MTVRMVATAIFIPHYLFSENATNISCFFIIMKNFKLLRSRFNVYNLMHLTAL
jgi:hypothetical protein